MHLPLLIAMLAVRVQVRLDGVPMANFQLEYADGGRAWKATTNARGVARLELPEKFEEWNLAPVSEDYVLRDGQQQNGVWKIDAEHSAIWRQRTHPRTCDAWREVMDIPRGAVRTESASEYDAWYASLSPQELANCETLAALEKRVGSKAPWYFYEFLGVPPGCANGVHPGQELDWTAWYRGLLENATGAKPGPCESDWKRWWAEQGYPPIPDRVPDAPRNRVPDAVRQDIQREIRERLEAYARGDAAAWGAHVMDGCFCGGSTKEAIQKEIAGRASSFKNWYGPLEQFDLRVRGTTAVAQYVITENVEVGSATTSNRQRRLETYIRNGERWLLLAGMDIALPRDPAVATVDPDTYDRFAGRYEYAPGIIDTVMREGDRLFVQPSDQPKEELLPENDVTYFARGQGWRIVFERDANGVVTLLRFRQNGQEFVARKIR